MAPIKILSRIASEARKELRLALRRPVSLFGLVAGPFLVMALFGIGFIGSARPLQAILVIPEGIPVPRDAAYYERLSGYGLDVLDLMTDREAAIARLEAGESDLLVIAPQDPRERFLDNQRSVIEVWYRQVDPTLAAYAELAAARLADQVNREVVRRAVEEGYDTVVSVGDDGTVTLSPEIIAEPVTVATRNIAPSSPGVVRFYGPAVFALIVQHLALMLGALSVFRERRSGFLELLRVSPGSVAELVAGKMVAFALLTGAVAAVLTWVLVEPIGIPFLGEPLVYAATVAALVLAALVAGLFVGTVADSELQAVHLALLALLVSVFFGGFVVPVAAFRPEIRAMVDVLPARNAAVTLQDVMLYGDPHAPWRVASMVAVAAVLFLPTLILLRRRQQGP